MERRSSAHRNTVLVIGAVLVGCGSSSDALSSPPPVTFAISITSVRAAGGPEMVDGCVETGRDSRGTVIVAVAGPPTGYLNPSGKCAVNSACGYLAATLTPDAADGITRSVRSAITDINLPLLEPGSSEPAVEGNYQLSVDLRTPAHEAAADGDGRPVSATLPLTLKLPGGCTDGGAAPLDGGNPEAGGADDEAEASAPADADASADDASAEGGSESGSD